MTNFICNTPPSQPDQRDIPFVPKIWPRSKFSPSIDLRPNVEEVEDQLDIGSCVANGIVAQCEWLSNLKGIHLDLSRMFLYTATLAYENRLGEEGLIPRDALKMAYRYGIPLEGPQGTEVGYPYDTTKKAIDPPLAAYIEARNRRVERFEAVVAPGNGLEKDDKIDRILSALNEGLTVGIAMSVTRSIFGLTGPWRTHQYKLGTEDSYVGGHYMEIIGYDESCKLFLVQNSWGPKWADGGFCGLPYDIVGEMFFEAWIIRSFNGCSVPEAPGIKLELLNKYYIQARIVPEVAELKSFTNIWIGARFKDGSIYLRNNENNNNWDKYVGGEMLPAYRTVLGEENLIKVVNGMDLKPFEGVELYVAYGYNPLTWKLQKICTVPHFS